MGGIGSALAWLLGLIPISLLWSAWSNRQARLKAEASKSHLTVKDGAQHLGDAASGFVVRWVGLTANNWNNPPIRIRRIRITWPPLARAVVKDALIIDPNERFRRSFDFDIPPVDKQPFKVTLLVRINWLLRALPTPLSRLHATIYAETIDAQRRRTTLSLRSNEVDWSKSPQE